MVEKFSHTVEIILNNRRIRIPIRSGIGFSNIYLRDDWMTYLMRIVPPSVEIFIDVGTNIGQTLIKLKAFLPNCLYQGFEPNSQCVSYVEKLLEANNWIRNASIFSIGLSNETEIVHFFKNKDIDNDATIRNELRPDYFSDQKHYVPFFHMINYPTH